MLISLTVSVIQMELIHIQSKVLKISIKLVNICRVYLGHNNFVKVINFISQSYLNFSNLFNYIFAVSPNSVSMRTVYIYFILAFEALFIASYNA